MRDKEKKKKVDREWRRRNSVRVNKYRQEWKKKIKSQIKEYKQGKSCVDCGYSGKEFPEVLEFDHLSDKKFNIGEGKRSFETIMKEIAKCDIVCANCHRVRTFYGKKD